MRDQALLGLLRVQHGHHGVVLGQHAGIADLAALLGVERRHVQYHAAFLACHQRINLRSILHDGQHARVGVVFGIAHELRGAHGLQDLGHHAAVGGPGGLGILRVGSAGTLALLVHTATKALHVHLDAALVAQLARDLHGEAVRVVQRERAVARQHVAFELGQRLVEERAALAQVRAEALFLGQDDAAHEFAVLHDLGVYVAHEIHDLVHKPSRWPFITARRSRRRST